MQSLTEDQLIAEVQKGTPEVQLPGVEFKESWNSDYGEDISAIANELNLATGWLVVGVRDKGGLTGKDINWLKKVELDVSNQIRGHLSPAWAVKSIVGKSLPGGCCLLVEIKNPGDIVRWKDIAYKLLGTTSSEMHPSELLARSIKLPGADISKGHYDGKIDPALITEFAQKLQELGVEDFNFDLSRTTSEEILSKLNIASTITAGILFGEYSFRFVHFDRNGDILDQTPKKGLYRMLSDQFIEDIQSWTRRQGTVLHGNSATAAEETPYPIKALREVLGNAVAHSLYSKAAGDIVVELHHNRLVVRNNCRKEAKAFVEKWFSRSHFVYNKHLMNTLRAAKITDEQGTGKIRVFRYMLEAGKGEPLVNFEEFPDFARWSVTLYNEESNAPLKLLVERLKPKFEDPDQWRIATALLLWRKKPWSQIRSYLDEHYARVAEEVLNRKDSPVVRIDDKLYTKRWAEVALTGQISKQFSMAEENDLLDFFQRYTMQPPRDGHISAEEAREFMGLSDSKSEMTQLSNLFRKWKDRELVKMVKKGHWQFLPPKP